MWNISDRPDEEMIRKLEDYCNDCRNEAIRMDGDVISKLEAFSM